MPCKHDISMLVRCRDCDFERAEEEKAAKAPPSPISTRIDELTACLAELDSCEPRRRVQVLAKFAMQRNNDGFALGEKFGRFNAFNEAADEAQRNIASNAKALWNSGDINTSDAISTLLEETVDRIRNLAKATGMREMFNCKAEDMEPGR